MKKEKFILGMAFVFTLITTSCVKEDVSLQNNEQQVIYELTNIDLVPNKQDLNFLMQNSVDKDDEKISYQLYNLSLAIESLIKDPVFNKQVIALAKANKNQTVSIKELAVLKPEFKTIINDALKSSNSSIEKIEKEMTRDNGEYIEYYIPSIFIPNLNTLDNDLQPIISPNIVANSDEDSKLEDKIVAWYFTNSGMKKEILVSEEESLKTLNPLFILDNAEGVSNQTQIATLPSFVSKSTSAKVQATTFKSNEYRINHRYENSGKSEFTVVSYRISPNGTIHWVYNSGGYDIFYHVRKKDIGKNLNGWRFYSNKDTPYSTNHFVYNTYERDWNSSPKNLGNYSANGTTVFLNGRRKYSSEWYAFSPNGLLRANLQGVENSSSGTNIYSNSKGYLKVHR